MDDLTFLGRVTVTVADDPQMLPELLEAIAEGISRRDAKQENWKEMVAEWIFAILRNPATTPPENGCYDGVSVTYMLEKLDLRPKYAVTLRKLRNKFGIPNEDAE